MDFSVIGANIVKLISTYWKVFLIDGVTKTLQFTCIAVVLGAILGTYGAGQNYSAYPVLCFDNVVSGMTHSISGFCSGCKPFAHSVTDFRDYTYGGYMVVIVVPETDFTSNVHLCIAVYGKCDKENDV